MNIYYFYQYSYITDTFLSFSKKLNTNILLYILLSRYKILIFIIHLNNLIFQYFNIRILIYFYQYSYITESFLSFSTRLITNILLYILLLRYKYFLFMLFIIYLNISTILLYYWDIFKFFNKINHQYFIIHFVVPL